MKAQAKVMEKPAVRIQDHAVMLSVDMSRMHVWRKIDTSDVEVKPDEDGNEADKNAVHANKEILNCESLKKIGRIHTEVRSYLYSRCLPSVFKKGVYMLPIDLLQEVVDKLEEFEKRIYDTFEEFVEEYDQAIKDAKERLTGRLFDPRDYPSKDRLKYLFEFRYHLLEMTVPGSLKSVKASVYKKEMQKAEALMENTKRQIAATLYEEFQKLVNRMTTNLADTEDGKRKKFKDSTFEKMQEWIHLFKARNLTDDQTIVKMVEQAKILVQDVDAKTVRDSDLVRKQLVGQFEKLEKALEKQIETLPERAISFD